MKAEVPVGVELPLPVKHADFEPVVGHDAAVAFGEIRIFSTNTSGIDVSSSLRTARR